MSDLSELSNLSQLLNIPQDVLARELWFNTFYSMYIDNIWNNAEVWRYISMFSLLLLILYKKKIRFFHTKQEKIETDRCIFINSDLIMSQDFLKEFLVELSINETFHQPRYEKIKDFYNYFKQEEHKYLNMVIKDPLEDFCKNLSKLQKFLDKHFSQIHIPDVYRLYPDLKHDPNFNYSDFQQQLYELCKDAEILYSNYRLAVKAKLSI